MNSDSSDNGEPGESIRDELARSNSQTPHRLLFGGEHHAPSASNNSSETSSPAPYTHNSPLNAGIPSLLQTPPQMHDRPPRAPFYTRHAGINGSSNSVTPISQPSFRPITTLTRHQPQMGVDPNSESTSGENSSARSPMSTDDEKMSNLIHSFPTRSNRKENQNIKFRRISHLDAPDMTLSASYSPRSAVPPTTTLMRSNSIRRTSLDAQMLNSPLPKSINRVLMDLQREEEPLLDEIDHERSINEDAVNGLPLVEDIPNISQIGDIAMRSDVSDNSSEPLFESEHFMVTTRNIPIPASQLKDHNTYISQSSKLNPENSFLSRKDLSPAPSSPGLVAARTKRKLSMTEFGVITEKTDVHGPIKRAFIRRPISPHILSTQTNFIYSGAPTMNISHYPTRHTSASPSHIGLASPNLHMSSRARTISSSSISGSMLQDGQSHTQLTGAFSFDQQQTNSGLSSAMAVSSPASPKPLGQMLNLSAAGTDFSKMSISSQSPTSESSILPTRRK